jgi:predicted LPLAT superfamily acyltransferase
MPSKSLLSYIGFGLAVLAVVLGVVKPEWSDIAWLVAGVLGYGSIELVRAQVDSQGWKTMAILIVVGILAVLQVLAVITPEIFQALIIAFAPITGITVQQSLAKAEVVAKVISK